MSMPRYEGEEDHEDLSKLLQNELAVSTVAATQNHAEIQGIFEEHADAVAARGTHLTESELAGVAAGGPPPDHVKSCGMCAKNVEHFVTYGESLRRDRAESAL